MRIGVIGPMGPDLFAENIVVTLRSMGNVAVPLGPSRRAIPTKAASALADVVLRATPVDIALQRHLVRQARERALDLVITVESTLQPATVEGIRKAGAKVVLWFPDHLANLDRQLMFLAPYDAVFFKDPLLVDRLRALLDLHVFYLPEACNPMWHRPIERDKVEPFIVLAGNMYPSRVVLLERLFRAGIPLRLYGSYFPRWMVPSAMFGCHTRQYLTRERKASIFRRAAGVLNNLHPSELSAVNCRLFEATGSGAAVLCEARPVLGEMFDLEREVLPFSDFDELVDQARLVLANSARGTEIGDAASARAHACHTYTLRLGEMLKRV